MKLYVQTKEATYEVDAPKVNSVEEFVVPEEYTKEGLEGVFDAKDHHVCKYCGSVAPGNYEDLLCDECRSIFGHSLYSEL